MGQHTQTRIVILGLLALALLAIVLAMIMSGLENRGLLNPAEITPAPVLLGGQTLSDSIDIDEMLSGIAASERQIHGVIVISSANTSTVTRIEESSLEDTRYLWQETQTGEQPSEILEAIEVRGITQTRSAASEAWVESQEIGQGWPKACNRSPNVLYSSQSDRTWASLVPCMSGQAIYQGVETYDGKKMRRYSLMADPLLLPEVDTSTTDSLTISLWFEQHTDLPFAVTWHDAQPDEMMLIYGQLELDYSVDDSLLFSITAHP